MAKRIITERTEPQGTYNMNHLIVALIAEIEAKGGTFANLEAELDGPFKGFAMEITVKRVVRWGSAHE